MNNTQIAYWGEEDLHFIEGKLNTKFREKMRGPIMTSGDSFEIRLAPIINLDSYFKLSEGISTVDIANTIIAGVRDKDKDVLFTISLIDAVLKARDDYQEQFEAYITRAYPDTKDELIKLVLRGQDLNLEELKQLRTVEPAHIELLLWIMPEDNINQLVHHLSAVQLISLASQGLHGDKVFEELSIREKLDTFIASDNDAAKTAIIASVSDDKFCETFNTLYPNTMAYTAVRELIHWINPNRFFDRKLAFVKTLLPEGDERDSITTVNEPLDCHKPEIVGGTLD